MKTNKSWKILSACSVGMLGVAIAIVACGEPAAPPHHGGEHPHGGGACRGQANMEGALTELREARGFLERAEHDKGGWRAKAVEETNAAIRETENGCAYADTH